MAIRDGIKKQNDAFDLSKEIVGSITKSVGSISKSLAEALVLGKDLNASLKQLAQAILVEIIAKTIERIALLGIEKILSEYIGKRVMVLEIEKLGITVNDNSLRNIIKNDTLFFKDNKFSRTEYEKFLLKNQISHSEFENKFKKNKIMYNKSHK